MLRLGIDPEKPYRATFICQDGLCCCNMALISFRLFRKNLGNLPDFFGQMVYRPPWQKNFRTPMLFGHVPMELSFLVITFLKKARSENKVQVKVTGSRRLKNRLAAPGSFLARTTIRAIATKFEEEIIRLKSLCTVTWT